MTLGGLVGFLAIALAFGAAAVRTRDSFNVASSLVVLAFAVLLTVRLGLDATRFVANVDQLVMVVGALLLAVAITLRNGLPASIEDRLMHGAAFREWAFDRSLAKARRPFMDAARARDESMHAKARWRHLLTARPPSPAWASLADRVARGDEEWALRAGSGAAQHWLPWAARNDEIGRDWAALRAPLQAQRSAREPIVRRVSWLVTAASAVSIVAGVLNVPTGIRSLPPAGRAALVPEPVMSGGVYLAPLGGFPAAELEGLIEFYAERYNLPVGVLPPAEIAAVPRDPTRNQLSSEDLIGGVVARYPQAVLGNLVVIGVLPADMYSRGRPDWRFVFGTWSEAHLGVISTARMGARLGPFERQIELARLRKMLTRYIGFMYFGLPESTDPKSVLYAPLLSLDDLDTMGEEF